MKEAYATFPPITASKTLVADPASETNTLLADGYDYVLLNNNQFTAGHLVEIDLRGLTIADKVLKINNIHMARLPSFDNTFPKALDVRNEPQAGIYQVTDIHLITTSPIVMNVNTAEAGEAPAQNKPVQMEQAVNYFGQATNNNQYPLPTPGLIATTTELELPGMNVDPNMIVFCQTDVLTGNVRSNANLASQLVTIDSSVYGMGDMAALESLFCYRFIYGSWTSQSAAPTFSGVVQAKIGSSIVQMNTTAKKPADLVRLSIMDQNFNTTNPLLE